MASRKQSMLTEKDKSITQRFQEDIPEIKSKQYKHKQVHIYDFEQIQDYKEVDRPILGQGKKKMIKETLDIEQEATQQFLIRQRENLMFVNYDFNPFSLNYQKKVPTKAYDDKKRGISKRGYLELEKLQKESFKKVSQKNIIPQVNELIQGNMEVDSKSLDEEMKEAEKMSRKTIKHFEKSSLIQKQMPIEEEAEEKHQVTLDFEDIIKIQEENYFVKKQSKINIFKILFDENHQSLIGKEILDKFYFNFNSMSQKLSSVRIPVYRQLSRFGRKLACDRIISNDQRLDAITSYELALKVENLNFFDLVSVGSGRFNQHFVYKIIYEDRDVMMREKSQASSEVSENEIDYADNTLNKMNFYRLKDEEVFEIKDYLRIPFAKSEKQYHDKCVARKENIVMNLEKQENLYQQTIRDKKLHTIIKTDVDERLVDFLEMDKPKELNQDKNIRANKLFKTKKESLKIRELLNTIVLKNSHQDRIQTLFSKGK